MCSILLRQAGVEVNKATTINGETPLFTACYDGYTEIVELLLAVDEVNMNKATTESGVTPLYIACNNGHEGVVKMLLQQAAVNVNTARTDDGATPLYTACYDGFTEIIKLLLAHSAVDINAATSNSGITPLHIASVNGHAAAVKLLLKRAEVDINLASGDGGITALFGASWKGHIEIVKMLLAHGDTDVNQATVDEGATPLHTACYEGHVEVVKVLLAVDGIALNTGNTLGATPLNVAIQEANIEIVELLLAQDKVDVNKATADEMFTPLHCAAMVGSRKAAQILVVAGARLSALDHDGDVPAQVATSHDQPVLAEWLFAVSGWSPLRVAAGCRLHKEAAFLLRRGRIDPDNPVRTTTKSIMTVIATSNALPAALPWQDAPQVCKATIKLVADATRGWHRTTHWLHHKTVRTVVVAVLIIAGRLSSGMFVKAGDNSVPVHKQRATVPRGH